MCNQLLLDLGLPVPKQRLVYDADRGGLGRQAHRLSVVKPLTATMAAASP